jgi:hypothetical protein
MVRTPLNDRGGLRIRNGAAKQQENSHRIAAALSAAY